MSKVRVTDITKQGFLKWCLSMLKKEVLKSFRSDLDSKINWVILVIFWIWKMLERKENKLIGIIESNRARSTLADNEHVPSREGLINELLLLFA